MDTPVDPHRTQRIIENIYWKTMSRIIILTLVQNVKHNIHFFLLFNSLILDIKKWTQSLDMQI